MHPRRHALLKRSTSAHCFANASGLPTMPAVAVRRGISNPAGWCVPPLGPHRRWGSTPRALTHCLDHAKAARRVPVQKAHPPARPPTSQLPQLADVRTRRQGPEQTSESTPYARAALRPKLGAVASRLGADPSKPNSYRSRLLPRRASARVSSSLPTARLGRHTLKSQRHRIRLEGRQRDPYRGR